MAFQSLPTADVDGVTTLVQHDLGLADFEVERAALLAQLRVLLRRNMRVTFREPALARARPVTAARLTGALAGAMIGSRNLTERSAKPKN